MSEEQVAKVFEEFTKPKRVPLQNLAEQVWGSL